MATARRARPQRRLPLTHEQRLLRLELLRRRQRDQVTADVRRLSVLT